MRSLSLFPFGHGLSYTSFEYSDLNVTGKTAAEIRIGFTVRNTGAMAGAETAQLYIGMRDSAVFRSKHELKGFSKIFLEPGESRRIEFEPDSRSFSFWDCGNRDWCVEAGRYLIRVGGSSRDIRIETEVELLSTDSLSEQSLRMKEELARYFSPSIALFSDTSGGSSFEHLYGSPLPPLDRAPGADYDRNSTISDVSSTFIGRLIFLAVRQGIRKQFSGNEDRKTVMMMESMAREMPLRNISMMSGGALNMNTLDALIEMINGRFFRGLVGLINNK